MAKPHEEQEPPLAGGQPGPSQTGGPVPPQAGGGQPGPPQAGGPVPPQAGGGQPGPSQAGEGPPPPNDNTSYGLTFRNVTLLILAIGFIYIFGQAILGEAPVLDRLRDVAFARGLITFILALGTMLIALILTLSVVLGETVPSTLAQERFAKGKDILSVLIGVLGTIVGFYYGSPAQEGENGHDLQIASPQILPTNPTIGSEFTIFGFVTGGKPPYDYLITFSRGVQAIKGVTKDGWIKKKLKVPNIQPGQELKYNLEITDSNSVKKQYGDSDGTKIDISFEKLPDKSLQQNKSTP